MAVKRYLIVNADDFGQSSDVNRGIMKAHIDGIVTSASLMVRWPTAAEAAAFGKAHPDLSLGLHIELGEWAYGEKTWQPLYEVVPMNDLGVIKNEVQRQLASFRRLVGRNPTHLDSHQHVHRQEPVHSVLLELARELAIPLRHDSPVIGYCGAFYGQTTEGLPLPQAITVDAMKTILAELRPGITELACHPGEGKALVSAYSMERAEEVRTLCDPRVRVALADEGIRLRSFDGLPITQ